MWCMLSIQLKPILLMSTSLSETAVSVSCCCRCSDNHEGIGLVIPLQAATVLAVTLPDCDQQMDPCCITYMLKGTCVSLVALAHHVEVTWLE